MPDPLRARRLAKFKPVAQAAEYPGVRRRRRIISAGSLAALTLGLALVPLALGAAVIEHGHEREGLDDSLTHEAREQVAIVSDVFARARATTLLTARNPAFSGFYRTPGTREAKVRARGPQVREANRALAYLERLFPGSIGEACFIDHGGAENARAVRGRIAPLADLSDDETGASFFHPTFRLSPGRVYQSRPYVSPDTGEWVVSNSSRVPAPGGSSDAIVHYELTMESFRRAGAEAARGRAEVRIVDAETGNVVVNSAAPQRMGPTLGTPGERGYARLAAAGSRSGVVDVAGRRAAFERLPTGGGNANEWIVVATATTPAGSLATSLGFVHWTMLVAALLLVSFSVAHLRMAHGELRDAALTDSLTRLPNRRSLMADLDDLVPAATADEPLVLALYDLDGFKAYNDTFGHLTGDALLERLGARLAEAVAGRGTAYRMGGDEFCVVARVPNANAGEQVALAGACALREAGGSSAVDASYGTVLIPIEEREVAAALRSADLRMYARKDLARDRAATKPPSMQDAPAERPARALERR